MLLLILSRPMAPAQSFTVK
uniref:Uncharacterized protein n=1 Tax=Anguilla anguilla TaxID=7936 RepID=A0A0E9RFW9_ANGAN